MKTQHITISRRSQWVRIACVAALLAAAASLSACNKKTGGSSPVPDTTTTSVAATTTSTSAVSSDTTASAASTESTASTTAFTGTPSVGWCNATTLHVRKTPNQDYESIGGLSYGDKVTILGREGDWYKISFKGGEAYVNAQFIQATEITGSAAGAE